MTNEQERINNLSQEFSLAPSDIVLDASVYDKSSFNNYYLNSENSELIPDKINSLITKQLDNATINIKNVETDIDLEVKGIFKLIFTVQINSATNPQVYSEDKKVTVDLTSLVAERNISVYLDTVVKGVKLTPYGEELRKKLKPSLFAEKTATLEEIIGDGLTKRADKLVIKSFNDEQGSVVVSVASKLGSIEKSKDFNIEGFLTVAQYEARQKLVNDEKARLNSLVKSLDLNEFSEFFDQIKGKALVEITPELLNKIKLKSLQSEIVWDFDSFNKSEENNSFTISYKLKSLKEGLNEITSDNSSNLTFNKLFDIDILKDISDKEIEVIKNEITNPQSDYNKFLSSIPDSKIPENRQERFNSIKEALFTRIQDKINNATVKTTREFYDASLLSPDELKTIYTVLNQLLRIDLKIITNMYSELYTFPNSKLSWAVTIGGLWDATVITAAKMVRGYYVQPLLDNIFNYLVLNKDKFTSPSKQYALSEIKQYQFSNLENKDELEKQISNLIDTAFTNYLDFFLKIDWKYMIDGGPIVESSERYIHTKNVFPNLKPGRTWLASNWNKIFSAERHNNILNEQLKSLTSSLNLSGDDAEFVKNLMVRIMQPIYNIGVNYSNVMYKDLLQIAYDLSQNKE
ncbi:lipoprotein 17-related variable surface protein [Mycoplasma sp. HF14]